MNKRFLPLKLWLLALLVGAVSTVSAQPEAYNWRFGTKAGIQFPNGSPAIVSAPGAMSCYEGCASISDARGVLQCYSNGQNVWDRTGAIMPNGWLSGSHFSATQAALLVRAPADQSTYYLFTVDAVDNELRGGLRYSVVDMSLRAGLGDVRSNSIPLGGAQVTEKLTAVRHANGRDYWIVTHGWQNNLFYCYLLNPGGLAGAPVVSAVGSVHSGANGTNPVGPNAIGYLRASPDSRLLALGQGQRPGVEVFDFNPATGQVSSPRSVPLVNQPFYGVEFSADSRKLYVSAVNGSQVWQLDLAANPTWTNIPVPGSSVNGMQRGPDGQIYIAHAGRPQLTIIHNPNGAGLACNLEAQAFTLTSGTNAGGLPNMPNAFALAPTSMPGVSSCPGSPLTFTAPGPAPAGGVFTWDFGDPTSGALNAATEPTAAHTYSWGSNYYATLTLNVDGVPVAVWEYPALITPVPALNLGARYQYLCPNQTLVLGSGNAPAGTTYRWQDGSADPTYTVRAPGRYSLRLTSPQGCVVRDSVEVVNAEAPVVALGRDTLICNEWQPVTLRPRQEQPGDTYRWNDGTTTADYRASQPGLYWLEVRNLAGCAARDTIVVRAGGAADGCPGVKIANVITPNQDGQNDYFVLQGLNAPDWELTIYNRWGRLVHQQRSYHNDWAAPEQPAGIYYYLLQSTRTRQQLRGWLEVVR